MISPSDTRLLVGLAALIGLTAGCTAFLLMEGLHLMESVFGHGFQGMAGLPLSKRGMVLWAPPLGGLLVGLLLWVTKSEKDLHGVSEVLDALARKAGNLPVLPAFIRGFSTILTVGLGGSGGPEAPIVHMGAAVGSAIGRWGEVPPQFLKVLVAAGAAGGIGAAFNAPLAGVVFALEVILIDFTANAFSMVVISAVTAAITARTLLGGQAYFIAPVFGLARSWELIIYVVLGLAAAGVGNIFMSVLYNLEERFTKEVQRLPRIFRPALGAALVGALGFFLPQVLGTGRGYVQQAINGNIPLLLCGLLVIGKMFATGLTLGSGGSGGVFLPVLFVGAMLGHFVGSAAQLWFPSVIQPGAYALGGMAALFAAAFHAPITAILILFEMTRDYQLILPFMIASVIASLAAHRLHADNFNTRKLSLLGLRKKPVPAIDPLESIRAERVMAKHLETLTPEVTLARLTRFIEKSLHTGFPVVDKNNRVIGLVTYREVHDCFAAGELPEEGLIVKDIMREMVPLALPGDPLKDILRLMRSHDIDRVPVVDSRESRILIGIVTHSDIIGAFGTLLTGDPPPPAR